MMKTKPLWMSRWAPPGRWCPSGDVPQSSRLRAIRKRDVYGTSFLYILLCFGVLVALVSCRGKSASVPDPDLLTAAWDNDVTTVKSLLEQGTDVNIRDEYNATALMYAAHRGHVEVAKILLAHKADINAGDVANVTALMEASRSGHLAVVTLLLEHNADVHARDKNLNTALIFAARGQCADIVQALLDKGADINAKNHRGLTALMGAAWAGRIDNVRKLLIYGADVNAQTKNGKTALMLASEREHFNTIALLQAFGAGKPSEEGSKDWELGFRMWSRESFWQGETSQFPVSACNLLLLMPPQVWNDLFAE